MVKLKKKTAINVEASTYILTHLKGKLLLSKVGDL